jgi:hypothetical protein
LECIDYKLDSSGSIYLQFRNTFSDDVRVLSITTFDSSTASSYSAATSVITRGNASSIFTITPTTTAQLVKGDKIRVPVIVTFERASGPSPPDHNVTGEIFAVVQ